MPRQDHEIRLEPGGSFFRAGMPGGIERGFRVRGHELKIKVRGGGRRRRF
ncbi:MAG: hypothetical protein AMXMBFR22_30000 [Phycisphaerae bacterium]